MVTLAQALRHVVRAFAHAAPAARSAPAQKPRPSPVSSTARTAASALARARPCAQASEQVVVEGVEHLGRFIVSVATPASAAVQDGGFGHAKFSGEFRPASASMRTNMLPRRHLRAGAAPTSTTVPSIGASMRCSIFMASMASTNSPLRTRWPSATASFTSCAVHAAG